MHRRGLDLGLHALVVIEPLKGSPESVTETIAGRTHFTWTPLTTAMGQIRAGQLLALAVSTGKRWFP